MQGDTLNRRTFLRQGVVSGMAAGWTLSRMTASSYGRVIGANERINLGLVGCGERGGYIIPNMVKPANANTGLVAVCDIWKSRLEKFVDTAEGLMGTKPKAYADYRKLLEDPQVDAVIFATPDHQHCGQTIDAIKAGKHIYIEKPIAALAGDLAELNKCYDTVKASKQVVQTGTHGVSCPGTRAVKQLIADHKLGKLFRVEGTETAYIPYWIHYQGPKTEAETDWKAFLYNRKYRPFDAHQYAAWMGYHDFTSGAIGGWMSHFINFVHFVTGCGFPLTATAYGGRYALTNDPRCDAPDQVTVLLDYGDGFHTQFVSHFGSALNNESIVFMFEKGCVKTRFGHFIGNPSYSSEGVDDSIKEQKLLDFEPPYPGAAHVKNWLDCIRNGGEPAASMEYAYKHGIAVIMGDMAYNLGRKVSFDNKKREVRP